MCNPCPCHCQLEPVVLFRVFAKEIRNGYMGSIQLGYTIDLSLALSYKDRNSAAMIDVWRGYRNPTTGALFSSTYKPLARIDR